MYLTVSVCETYDGMLKTQIFPHLVLDVTTDGVGAQTVKSFTFALGLPTISASYGQYGDLKYWKNIRQDENDYLVQICTPIDVIPQIIRNIVVTQNMSNAGIIYDDSFSKYFIHHCNILCGHQKSSFDFFTG